jgi:ribosomal protein L37AE/L43A
MKEAIRVCPVCLAEFRGAGKTPTAAAVDAQKRVLVHQLEHSYAEVQTASRRRPS